jgi:hypothetical protein
LVLVGAVLGAARSAHARDAVVLLEAAGLRPDLCVALRIQLTDVADVRCRTEPAGAAGLAARIGAAARLVASEPARLVVLLERDADARHVRMVLVGAPEDRAVLAIESIEDRAAPDVDRSLALKVRDTLDVMDARPANELALVVAPPAAPRTEHLAGLLEVGAAVSVNTHVRAAGLLGLGLRARRGAAYGELALGAQRSSSLVVKNQLGRVGRVFGPVSVGALAELGMLGVRAFGITTDGSHGDDARLLARLGVGLDLRATLLRGPTTVVLRCAPTLQIDPTRQRFELDGQPALDLGRVRAWLPLTLLVELPLARGRAGGHDA